MKTSLILGIILIVIGCLGIIFYDKLIVSHWSNFFSKEERKLSIKIAGIILIIVGIMIIFKSI